MKKILFGLLALSLSVTAFAVNPGTSKEATIDVETKLTVIDATGKLVIEELTDAGTWQIVSSTVGFDHGTVVKNSKEVPTSSIIKNFRVRKLDSNGGDTLSGDVFVGNAPVSVKMLNDPGTTGNFSGSLKSAANSIVHNFKYTPTPIIGPDKMAKFNIESQVPALSGTEPAGVYNRVETVRVTVAK